MHVGKQLPPRQRSTARWLAVLPYPIGWPKLYVCTVRLPSRSSLPAFRVTGNVGAVGNNHLMYLNPSYGAISFQPAPVSPSPCSIMIAADAFSSASWVKIVPYDLLAADDMAEVQISRALSPGKVAVASCGSSIPRIEVRLNLR